MMKSTNIDVYYFGTSLEGFQVYPETQAYHQFYNNTSEGWQLDVYAKNKRVTYTYVKYEGVLSSANMGRTGGCFGVSIRLHNHLCDNLAGLLNFFEAIEDKMLKEEVLLQQIPNQASIAFVPANFSKLLNYLDNWTASIKDTLLSDKHKQNFEIVAWNLNLKDSQEKVAFLHPKSNPKALRECLEATGRIKVSNKYELVKIPPSEQTVTDVAKIPPNTGENNRSLESRVAWLEKQMQTRINKEAEFDARLTALERAYENKVVPKRKWWRKFVKPPLAVILGMAVIVLTYKTINLSNDASPSTGSNTNIASSREGTKKMTDATSTRIEPTCVCIDSKQHNGRTIYILNTSKFLTYVQKTRKKAPKNTAEFKADLKAALDEGFQGKGADFSNTLSKNPTSIKNISNLIEKKVSYNNTQAWIKAINTGSHFAVVMAK